MKQKVIKCVLRFKCRAVQIIVGAEIEIICVPVYFLAVAFLSGCDHVVKRLKQNQDFPESPISV